MLHFLLTLLAFGNSAAFAAPTLTCRPSDHGDCELTIGAKDYEGCCDLK